MFYLTPHYLVYSSVLVRLRHVSREALQDVLSIGRQFVTAAAAGASRKPARRRKAASVLRYL